MPLNKYGEIIDDSNCPGCNRPIKDGWVACPHCGTSLQESHEKVRRKTRPVDDGNTCPECGKSKHPTASHFCPKCGEHVDIYNGDYCVECRKMVHDHCMIPTRNRVGGKCPVCGHGLLIKSELRKLC